MELGILLLSIYLVLCDIMIVLFVFRLAKQIFFVSSQESRRSILQCYLWMSASFQTWCQRISNKSEPISLRLKQQLSAHTHPAVSLQMTALRLDSHKTNLCNLSKHPSASFCILQQCLHRDFHQLRWLPYNTMSAESYNFRTGWEKVEEDAILDIFLCENCKRQVEQRQYVKFARSSCACCELSGGDCECERYTIPNWYLLQFAFS